MGQIAISLRERLVQGRRRLRTGSNQTDRHWKDSEKKAGSHSEDLRSARIGVKQGRHGHGDTMR